MYISWKQFGRIFIALCITYLAVTLSRNIFAHLSAHHLFFQLFDALNLGIHEAGHMVIRIIQSFTTGAEWMTFLRIFGGSLFQWGVPLCCVLYFVITRQNFAASATVFWLGESLLTSVDYIADATVMQLPLFGNAVGHDWNYLLFQLGVLHLDQQIAAGFRLAGMILVWISAILCWVLIARTVRIASRNR